MTVEPGSGRGKSRDISVAILGSGGYVGAACLLAAFLFGGSGPAWSFVGRLMACSFVLGAVLDPVLALVFRRSLWLTLYLVLGAIVSWIACGVGIWMAQHL